MSLLRAQTPHESADFRLAVDLYGRGLHWEAEPVFRRVTEQHAEFGQGWFGLAMCHYETRRLLAALPLFEKAERCPEPEAQAFTNHAVTLELLSRAGEARALLLKAIEIDPKHATAWLNLGKIEARAGRYAVAREHLERCIALDPASAQARYQLASAALRGGELELARKHVDIVLRQTAGHVGAVHLSARIARRDGDAAGAKKLLVRWRRLHDAEEKRKRIAGKVAGLMPLAFAELRRGKLAAAVGYFGEVIALDPANPHARSVLTQIEAKLRGSMTRSDAELAKKVSGLLAAASSSGSGSR